MSYDIDIGEHWFNYTYNLAPLFYDHIDAEEGVHRGGLHALHGLTGKQAREVLAGAFEAIHRTAYSAESITVFRRKYDAPNGWGNTDTALIFLARLMAACAENPRKKVSVT